MERVAAQEKGCCPLRGGRDEPREPSEPRKKKLGSIFSVLIITNSSF
jgi:hypothetical protein